MKKYLVTFESGLTTVMPEDKLIACKAWLLSIGADWKAI